jgi:hypothetical protein
MKHNQLSRPTALRWDGVIDALPHRLERRATVEDRILNLN